MAMGLKHQRDIQALRDELNAIKEIHVKEIESKDRIIAGMRERHDRELREREQTIENHSRNSRAVLAFMRKYGLEHVWRSFGGMGGSCSKRETCKKPSILVTQRDGDWYDFFLDHLEDRYRESGSTGVESIDLDGPLFDASKLSRPFAD